jgi:hypothetical protein
MMSADERERTRPGKVIVSAVVRGPSAPDAKQVAAMEDKLPRPPAGSIELQIRFVEARTIGRNGGSLDGRGIRAATVSLE